MPLFISFAGQPIYRLVHQNLPSRLFQEVLPKNRNVDQQILADSGIIQITLFILIMFVERQQEFFLLGLQRHFMKEIFNNLAFESTLVYQSITKKHCWLFSQTQGTKRFLFVSISESWICTAVSPFFSSPHFFSLFTVLVHLPHQHHFLAISFLYFSEYLIKLIFSFEVLES